MTTNSQDDQPATVAGPCNDETVTVPPPTQAALELAWSKEEPETELLRQSWGQAWSAAAVFLLCGVAVALVIGGWTLLQNRRHPSQSAEGRISNATLPAASLPPISSEPAPSPAARTPVAALPPSVTVTVTETPQAAPPPAPKASTPDVDQVFRNFVLQIPGMHVVNWGIAQNGARSICAYLGQGHTHDDATQQVLQNDPTFTPWQASAMVNASTTAYCPQYG